MRRRAIQHEPAYFKRFRMELDLVLPLPSVPALPEGCRWIAWDENLLRVHADVKARCFAAEIDRLVFPKLASSEGCLQLMREIRGRRGFRPQSTWLIARGAEYIATVQGVSERIGYGAIQNLGVVPEHRGQGLGTALLLQALQGLRSSGLAVVRLDVTAENATALRLYRRLGFRCRKCVYKIANPLAYVAADDWSV